MKSAYKRILLKLSGEVLGGEKGFGLDFDKVNEICQSIKMHPNGNAGGYRCRRRQLLERPLKR